MSQCSFICLLQIIFQNTLYISLLLMMVFPSTADTIVINVISIKKVYSQTCVIQQEIVWALQTSGCLLLQESGTERSYMSFLCKFHSAISNHLSIAISMSTGWSLKIGLTIHICLLLIVKQCHFVAVLIQFILICRIKSCSFI